jgi:hypothetical protein
LLCFGGSDKRWRCFLAISSFSYFAAVPAGKVRFVMAGQQIAKRIPLIKFPDRRAAAAAKSAAAGSPPPAGKQYCLLQVGGDVQCRLIFLFPFVPNQTHQPIRL